jgi:putrescine transport system ATP-binding protein
VSGKVCNVAYLGEHSTCHVKLESGFTMKAQLPNTTRTAEQTIRSADRIWLSWPADAAVVLTR